MVSTTNLVFLAAKILCLMVLSTNQATTSDFSGLLARLYKRAADSNRPLFIIFSNDGQANRIKKPYKIFDLIGKELDSGHHREAYDNLDRKKKHQHKAVSYRAQKDKNILGKQFSALLPYEKKRTIDEHPVLGSPVIKSLLRISNNLRCAARNECEDECSGKYESPKKQDKCKNVCEKKFECKPPEEKNECEDEADECGEEAEGPGSTKGWAVTEPWNGCPEC